MFPKGASSHFRIVSSLWLGGVKGRVYIKEGFTAVDLVHLTPRGTCRSDKDYMTKISSQLCYL